MPLPRLTVELQPDGLIATVLPQADGTERVIPIIRPLAMLDVLGRVLHAQALGEVRFGEDGNPSIAQAKCFAEHSGGYADANCPWCRASGRFRAAGTGAKAERQRTASQPWTQRGDAMVRRVPPGMTGAQVRAREAREASPPRDPRTQPRRPALQRQTTRSAEELGL